MGKYKRKLEALGLGDDGVIVDPGGTPGSTPIPDPISVSPQKIKPKMPNKNNWTQSQVVLVDGSFSYWEAKSGTSIFVDVDQLSNVPLLTPDGARKLFPK